MWSPERPPCSHTTSQNLNVQNYHFHLGLISAYDLLDPHYEKPNQAPIWGILITGRLTVQMR